MRPMYSSNAPTLRRHFTASSPSAIHIPSSSGTFNHHRYYPRPSRLLISPPRSTTGDSQNSSTSRDDNNSTPRQPRPPSNITPLVEDDEVEIKLRRGSRRKIQRRRLDQEAFLADELARIEMKEREEKRKKEKMTKETKQVAKKKWEDMTLNEKALELYVGEKGALYWLNKFAYASIYIIIGGWIIFRFVGPALNLYQLDAPPLPPAKMFKE